MLERPLKLELVLDLVLILDHPELALDREVFLVARLPDLTTADGSFSRTEVTREGKRATLPTPRDLGLFRDQSDKR